jgi:hypothetical protein
MILSFLPYLIGDGSLTDTTTSALRIFLAATTFSFCKRKLGENMADFALFSEAHFFDRCTPWG